MNESTLSDSAPRFEAERLLQGHARYVDDIILPGMTHAVIVRSPHAHARLLSVDVEVARRSPGVLLVLTGQDWAQSGLGTLPVADGRHRRNGQEIYRPEYPPLALDRVRHVGDCVAFVVAETENQATDAAELVASKYEILPAVTAPDQAITAGAPLVWNDCEDNICFVQTEGDGQATEAAFAGAAHVVKQRFTINRIMAAPMEPRSVVGKYDSSSGRYTIYTMAQRVFMYRADLAKYVLKVPESRLRVISPDVGGSFGVKDPVYNEAALVLLAARTVGRPVKWTSTRSESFLSDAHARDHVTDAELALDETGRFLAIRVNEVANAGAYSQTFFPSYTDNLGSLAGVYQTPAISATTTGVYTHTNPVRPYRGNGRTEYSYVIERMIDIAADELQIDPYEIRRRNIIPADAMPFKTGLTLTYDCGDFRKCLDVALEAADSGDFVARRAKSSERGMLRGLGVACVIERAAAKGFEGAEIRFERDGSVTLVSGALSQGQGHETVFTQLVADRLGLSPTRMNYFQGDTDQITFGEGTGGSRTAVMSGSAFHLAAEKIVEKAKAIAAHHLGLPASGLLFDGGIFSSPTTNETVLLDDVARFATDLTKLPSGMEPGLFAFAVFSVEVENFPNACHVCEVEVDPETGSVSIERYTVVDDVGTTLNAAMVKGQIAGGVVQGLGQILMEDIHYNAEGQLVTGSFMDYAMPRAADVSAINVLSQPTLTHTNPLGVKGAGETGSVGAMPAVANAVVDALSAFEIRHIEMPATPERVWRAIQAHRRACGGRGRMQRS